MAFLSQVSPEWRAIRDIQITKDRIFVTEQRGEHLELQAAGLRRLKWG
jgi:hypothetical protein